jgi:hypothetical protein
MTCRWPTELTATTRARAVRRRLGLLSVLLLLACTSSTPPPPTTSALPARTSTATANAPAPATSSPATSCQADTDCHVVSDYCGGCHCWAGTLSAEPPACTQGQVSCFVDPCRGVRAACQAGQCVALR